MIKKSPQGEQCRPGAEEMAAQPVNVLITGANRGLGLEMVKQILEAHRPVAKVFACCRDPEGTRAEVRTCFYILFLRVEINLAQHRVAESDRREKLQNEP